jgi:hypothetical protein
MPLILGTNSIKDTGFNVANSLRFDDGSSDNLSITPASNGNDRTGTFSWWFKRGDTGATKYFYGQTISGSGVGSGILLSSDKIYIFQYDGTSPFNPANYDFGLTSQAVFRDHSAWYHAVLSIDTDNSTQADRIKLYVNGVSQTLESAGSQGFPAQNLDTAFFQSATARIGSDASGGNNFDGYIAEFVGIDGTALDPTSFGEFDEDTGIWKPIDVSGLTFGTNGFYLDFEDSGSLGSDVSGNGNNFTVNNLTSIDQSTDTCTNNYCTLNPLSADEMTFSQGNLKVVTASSPRTDDNARGTIGVNSGKWYWEIKSSGALTPAVIGICFDELKMGSDLSGLTGVYAIQNAGGTYAYRRENGTTAETSGFPNPVNNDIINVAFDCDNAKLYIGINGTYYNQAGSTGNPATGSNETFSGIDMNFFWLPWIESRSTAAQGEANFGGTDSFTVSSGNSDGNGYGNFEYSVPSGYYALNTKNLAAYG